MKKVAILLAISAAMLACAVLAISTQRDNSIDPLPDDQVELSKEFDGTTYKLTNDGRLFRVDIRSNRWHYQDTVFQREEMEGAYLHEGETTYRFDAGSGVKVAVRRNFQESFEELDIGLPGLRKMIGEERGWGALTLQSPKARDVSDYVALRNQILNEGKSFLDASVAPDDKHVHSGKRSLLSIAPAKPANMVTCKASISSPLVYFKNGDDFWYQAFYFAEDALPFTIMDLECEWIKQHAGIRLCITEKGHLEAELKSLDKPRFRQAPSNPVVFPLGRWVKVLTQIHLSSEKDGHVKIWQDDALIVDESGTTLPLRSAIYSSLEIGISAHSYGNQTAKLWIDDVQVSDKPIKPSIDRSVD